MADRVNAVGNEVPEKEPHIRYLLLADIRCLLAYMRARQQGKRTSHVGSSAHALALQKFEEAARGS